MGVDFAAILPHRVTHSDLSDLPERLNGRRELRSVLRKLGCRFFDRWAWSWEIKRFGPSDMEKRWDEGDSFPLSGPLTSVYLGRHCCEVVCWGHRWWAFLTDVSIRQGLRTVCRELATTFDPGSAAAIYVPDSAYDESLALDKTTLRFDEICDWMCQRFGPPANRIEDIYHEQGDSITSAGYFVDRFDSPT